MKGRRKKRVKNKAGSKREKGETTKDIDGCNDDAGKANEAVASSGIQAIRDEIRAFRADFKNYIGAFRLSLRDDMRNELNDFRGEINQKF